MDDKLSDKGVCGSSRESAFTLRIVLVAVFTASQLPSRSRSRVRSRVRSGSRPAPVACPSSVSMRRFGVVGLQLALRVAIAARLLGGRAIAAGCRTEKAANGNNTNKKIMYVF